jgi:hypothetical protein
VPCRVQIPAKAQSGRLSSSANHVAVFLGFVSAYSQNDVEGTRHRLSGFSQRRQCGLVVFLMLVIGAQPKLRRPRHAPAHPGQLTLTVGRSAHDRGGVSGKTPGIGGRLPVRSRLNAKSRLIASWLRVIE